MKKITLLVLATALVTNLIIGCDFNDDGANSTVTEANSMNGTWKLSTVKGGENGLEHHFNTGDVSWHFEAENSKISIENNLKPNEYKPYSGLPTGNYNYSLFFSYIIIDGSDIGLTQINKNVLIIDENKKRNGNYTDGYILVFNR